MKVLLSGPILTSALADATGIELTGLPPATAQTPIAPLAAGLIAAGHDVHVLTLDPSVDAVETYSREGLRVTFCPLRAAPRYRARARMADLFAVEIGHLTRAMAASDADIVHAHWTYEHAEAALRSGKPHLATMHDLGWDYLFQFRDAYRAMRLVMKYRAMVRLKNLTVVGGFMRPKLWQYGFRGHVDIVPNPIAAAPWREKPLDAPVLVTVGNPNPIKNVAAAVAAFAQVRTRWPDAEFHLFGPGLDPGCALAQGQPGVVAHGNVPHGELMAFLSERATLMVHPARLETFGVVIGEAKVRGVPAIAGANAGGTVDVIGKAGFLCDIGNPDAIAAAIVGALNEGGAYRNLQQASHDDMEERFSVASVTARYVAIYERILNRWAYSGGGKRASRA
jgi:glycosyltransferase involved in cell wall biosynthesis